jgi:mRNA interferase RelE/StbE
VYRIEIRPRAQRALDKLPKSDFKAVIEAIKSLAQTTRTREIEKVKTTGLWRIRQGDYRIIYAIMSILLPLSVCAIGGRYTERFNLESDVVPGLGPRVYYGDKLFK